MRKAAKYPKSGSIRVILDSKRAEAAEIQRLRDLKGNADQDGEGAKKKRLARSMSADPDEDIHSLSESDIRLVKDRYCESVLSIRSVVHPTSYLETTIHVLKGNIGAGILAMGDVLKNSGMLLGPCGLVCIGILSTYCVHVLLECANKCGTKWRLPVDPTYAETVELSFKLGPKCFKYLSNIAKWCVIYALIATQLGFCSVYYLVIGNSVSRFAGLAGYHWNIRVIICIIYPMILGISLIRNLKYLAPLSLIANGLIVLVLTMVMLVVCRGLPNISERPLVAPFMRWPFAFGTIIFSYEGISLVIPLRNEMKNPDAFQSPLGVLNTSMSLVITVYTIFGILCYLKYGDDIFGNVTMNLPEGAWITMVAEGAVATALLFSYPLQFYVALKLILEIMAKKLGSLVDGDTKMLIMEFSIRIILVTITCALALGVPHLSLCISMVGAMCSTWLAIIFPVLCHMSLYSPWSKNHKTDNMKRISYKVLMWFGFSFHIICLLIGILGFFTGTIVSGYDLVTELKRDFS